MTKKRIIIVGGVAGGASTAVRLRRLDETAEITIFERGQYISFANCGLPYHLGGEIPQREQLILLAPQQLKTRFNIEVKTQHTVRQVFSDRQLVEVYDQKTDTTFQQPYDELVLATGAKALRPSIPGIDLPGHFVLRTIPDIDKIMEWVATHAVRRAVVVGAGYIGLETVEQLQRRGLQVAVVEMLGQVMGLLDPEIAALLHQELIRHGVEVCLNDGVDRFEASADLEQAQASVVVLKSGRQLPADLVILGMGIKPEVELALSAGIEMGHKGGIRVDKHLRTSNPHIWAVGDVIETPNPIIGTWGSVALAGPANQQARVVADNIYGAQKVWDHGLGTSVVRMFDLVAAMTGVNEKTLKSAQMTYQKIYLHPLQHVGYYPGGQPMTIKLLFHPQTGHIYGTQIVGKEGIDKRIDVLATALHSKMTVDDLVELELAYSPPFGAARDPINMAGMIAQNVVTGKVCVAHWDELDDLRKHHAFLLDVRETQETEKYPLPDWYNIPLNQLRERLKELPRERKIVVACMSGQRSYYACRILTQNGYDCMNLSGSYNMLKLVEWLNNSQERHSG